MVKSQNRIEPSRLDALFHALSDPTRRAILRQIASQSRTAGQLAEPFSMSQPAISKHLSVLERADLVLREKKGSFHFISINAGPMRNAHRWLSYYEKFWGDGLDALAQAFEDRKELK